MSASQDTWIEIHSVLLSAMAAGSAVLLLISIVATPWLVARLPTDYLLQRQHRAPENPILHLIVKILLTILGLILVIAGVVMLLIPGPGLITLLVGLSLASFPGKRKLLRYIASRDSVFNSLNWMRKRHLKAPLLHPDFDDIQN